MPRASRRRPGLIGVRDAGDYEEQGLFQPAGRTEDGFRLYPQREVDRLLLIKQMKPLYFTVQELGELLAAHDALAGGDPGPGEMGVGSG